MSQARPARFGAAQLITTVRFRCPAMHRRHDGRR
ncbi:Uncharacterised protein [Nocardia cyriacigeorgica]|uniref:Uncharacterized protein n=1 Tax=Nocardia cyriacigeorgica TaxID=135487 RepID=A0A4U8W3I4_9NOCA|nr:Uncharacterised protein [Nocardia cyriacigeorgica]